MFCPLEFFFFFSLFIFFFQGLFSSLLFFGVSSSAPPGWVTLPQSALMWIKEHNIQQKSLTQNYDQYL